MSAVEGVGSFVSAATSLCKVAAALRMTVVGVEFMDSMKKVFHFDSEPGPYVADAAVLCCFDQRIRLAVHKFLQKQGILRPDMIVVAGGGKPWHRRAMILSATSFWSRCECPSGCTRPSVCF